MLSLSRREAVAAWPQTPAVQMVGLWLVTTQCNNIQLITESHRPLYCGLDMLAEESHLQGNVKCVGCRNIARWRGKQWCWGALHFSAGGLCVYLGGLEIIKLTKTPLIYNVSRFNLGELWALFAGGSPPKPPVAMGLVSIVTNCWCWHSLNTLLTLLSVFVPRAVNLKQQIVPA